MARLRQVELPPPELELTPFIDIVFQLLVFLLVANDLSRREVEDLDLPLAPHSSEDRDSPASRLTLNLRDGPPGDPLAVVRGEILDGAGLLRVLREHAASHPAREGPRAPSVLLRAGEGTSWRRVQEVLAACGAEGVGIDRIDFATEGPVPAREGR